MKLKTFSTNEGLVFDNGTKVVDYHDQDCCENVYADWDQLKDTVAMSHEFPEKIEIEKVEDLGIRIDGFFIPCYNSQNGYYGSDLEIHIAYPDGKKTVIDVSEAVEDQID